MKKNWKRILSMFLAFVMVFGMLPVNAFADETEPVTTEETSVTEPAAAEAAAISAEETTVPVTEAPVIETTVPVTEAPEVETTVPVTEAPEVETTVPVTEAPEVEPTVPVTEAPVEEPTVPVTEAPAEEPKAAKDKVSDSAANEAAAEATESEVTEPEATEAEEKGIRKGPMISCAPSRVPADDDTLFAGYADHIWFGTDIAFFGTSGREQLDEDTRVLYDALVPLLKQIASGERTSGLIKVGTTLDPTDPEYVADVEVSFNTDIFDFAGLLDALLADMPYEMYWYDKTAGSTYMYATDSDGVYYLHYFYFSVASQYNDGSYDTFEYEDGSLENVYYTASPAKVSAVQDTAAAAQAVVDSVAADPDVKTDYDKLLAYRDWICENTSYNKDVESGDLTFSENIDPWQVIYVFDGNASTDVVCEGYSKAFQYLCDLTDFSTDANGDENVTCYSVTGTMTGNTSSGAHMWNIVDIEGTHYLADITNSDEGTVGDDGSLFLVGTTPETADTYVFDTKGTSTTRFTYDSDTKSLWGSSGILTLSETNYEPPVEEEPEVPDESEPSDGMTQAEFAAELAANAGTNYILSQSVTITEDMTIHMATETVPYDHSIRIPQGVTLTVAGGATLTVETNLTLNGGTVIVEEGGKLVMGTSDTRGTLYVWGGSILDVAAETGLDLSYGHVIVKHGTSYEIPSWIPGDSISAQAYISEPEQLQSILALTQYSYIDIYVQCDLTVTEDITVAGNQFLCVQYPYTMTVNEGVTVTVAADGVLFNSSNAVINNNGRILCYGQFQNYGTLNGNAVEIAGQETDDETMSQAEFAAELAENAGTNYILSKSVTITEDMTIRMATETVPYNHSVRIPKGVTLTVASGATLTVETNLTLDGGSVIVEEGGKLVIGTSDTRGMLYVWDGSTLDVAAETGLDLSHGRLTVEHGSDYEIPGWITDDSINAQAYINEPEQLQSMLALTQYAFVDIYVQCDLTVTEDITVAGNQFLGIQPPFSMTVNEGVTVTVESDGTLCNNSVINNNGRILCYGQFQNYGTLNGNAVEIVRQEMDEATFLEEMAGSGGFYRLVNNLTITGNVEIPAGQVVYVDDNTTLTVAEGATVTVNGQLSTNNGSIIVNGTLINNGWMHIDSISSTGSITIGSAGTCQNNAGMFIGGGTLTIDGTYTPGENGYVELDDTKAVINGIEKIGERIQLLIVTKTEEELIAALEKREGFAYQHVYTDEDIVLNSDLTVPEGVFLILSYSNGNGSDYKTLTIPEGVTLTVDGQLGISGRGELVLDPGSRLVNNGSVNVSGRLVNNGTIEGNDVEIYGNGTIIMPEMSQADFEAAVAAAEAAGETYYLNGSVTLTSDMTIACNVCVEEGGSLTVADGACLTVNSYEDGSFAQLSIDGEMTVQSGASLVLNTLVHAYRGTLTVEDGVTILAEIDGELVEGTFERIWFNRTLGGQVVGIADELLSIEFYPATTADLEAALATTGYASVPVFVQNDMTLDRNITVAEKASLEVSDGHTMKVPAGITLTNNGNINIPYNNRLEILMGAELVNNGDISVDEYAQLVIRGTLSGDGNIYGSIIWGEMSHEDLMAAMAQCAATESNWIHESITTLDPNFNEGFLRTSDLGIRSDGEVANELYLVEGGSIIVPAGCTLEVTNPLIVKEGGKVIIEEGGKLIVNGLLSVEGGTVYIAGDFEEGENSRIEGHLTFAGETDPWLSETWLDNREEGWYWPEENTLHEAHGLHVMDCHWRIYFLNTWDAENMVWNAVPVIPTEVSEYMTITRIMDMEDQFIRGDQEYAEYYVCVDVFGTLERQDVNLFVNGNPYPYELFQRTVAFYSEPTVSMDTLINDGHHSMNGETEEEAVYWLVKEPEYYDVLNFSWNLETWGEDYTQYTGGDPLVTLDETQTEQGIYKFIIDPDYVEYTKFNWKNFNLQIHMELDDNRDGEDNINIEYWDRDLWIEPAPQAEPKAHLRINNQTYLVFENDIIYREFPTGEYDEWGNEIWDREQCSLPEGVSYVPEDNKLILDNAHLERLELAYMDSWEDDEGYHEEQRLPSENLSLVVYGESSIMNGSECAMIIRNGTNVNISGTGSLHLYAENSPDNINEEGNRYAYPTVRINDGSSLTIGGNVEVTAEIAGSGFHGDMPAQMSAIDGYSEDPAFGNALTISDNAVLNIATPEGARTLDESQENYGGTRGIVSVNIEVNDNATLNTGSIYLWDTVDFTMNGGTVNLDPIGEVFYNYRLEDLLLSNLGIYLEHEDSVFTMNGGTINMDLNPNEANDGNFNYNTFQGINAALGHVYINGGEININGENAMGGNGIAIQCGWTEEGPDFDAPASSLTFTGGTVNISGAEGEFEGIYVAPAANAAFSGGAVYAAGGESYFEGHVDWTGNTELTGNIYVLDGSDVIVKNGATLTITDTTDVMPGGKILVEDGGTLYVRGILNIEGTVYMRSGASLSTDPGHQINGKITWEGDTAPYLTATWLDNYDNEGWYMNDEFFEENGLMSMEEHWRIFFLNTWDAENLIWNSVPVIPTENSEFMTITRVMDMEDQHIREDQDPAYSNYFVRVEVYGTLDRQDVTLSANGYSIPFEIHERHTGFFRTAEFTLDSIIQGHDFVLDPTAEENSIYWLVRDTENYDIVYEEFNYRTWNDEDYSDYITGEDLIVLDDSRKDEGIYKITVDPGFVDYVQYDFKNFEIRVNMTLDHNGDDEIYEEPNNGGMWIQPPELKDPAAALNIDNAEYMIFDTGRIFRDVFGGYDEWGNQIWRRQETSLPKGVSYVLENNQLILDNANLTSLNLHPTVSGYDEEGNFWVAFGLPNENLTITLVGSSTIENHCNAALWFNDGTNATITGNGQLYAKTTNYPDYRDENGELWCSNTINVHNGSSLTIGGNATVTAELSGHGYWDNGEGATCHPISGTYEGEALEITGNATVITVVPNGVRRYDESGSTSQIGGYVGIQNFNSITVSGGTLNTDHLNFYDGGQFNMTGGVANFRDIGGVNLHPETGEPIYHYEAINMRNGSVNISGGELNIDVTAREGETIDNAGFYGINAVNGTIDISGGTINITGSTDGWAIIADTEYDDNGPIDGTGSTLSITGGTINVNVPGKIYHGGVVVSDFCEGYFAGGEINDDYGIHRFFGETLWEGTVLNGIAANVYTHGPGSFHMSDGQINLTGDSYEENGETIRNRAIFQPNAGGSIYGGQINLTNGTYINNMNLAVDGGEITIENDWPDVPGLENNLYFATTGGTMDITANGTAIVSNGTFHQMGGEITAVNTSDSMPVMVSSGQTLQNTGTLNLRGGNIGMVQAYNFDQAGTENESMLFVGAVAEGPAPELNISDTKIGLYLNGPAFITGGADVNIQVAGEPINEDRQWPMAIYVEKHTGNPDLSGDNVSGLVITGGANVNLVSEDTAGVDAMSKGIVAWYSPVAIRGTDETDVPKVTIDAEMAVYSVSNALEDTNFNEDITFFDQSGAEVTLTSRDFTETEETGDFLHTLMDGESYMGYATIGKSSVMTVDEFLAGVAAAEANGEYYYTPDRNVIIDRDVELDALINGVYLADGIELIVTNGAVLTSNMEISVTTGSKLTVETGSRLVNQGTMIVNGTVSISDDGDYAGYVHNTESLIQVYGMGADIPSVTGIPAEYLELFTYCSSQDLMHNILAEYADWGGINFQIFGSITLNTMTIPENVRMWPITGGSITVAEGAFLTVNGTIGASQLIIDGKLINNGDIDASSITVNGTFENNAELMLSRDSVLTINGTMDNNAELLVGYTYEFDENNEMIRVVDAATLVIAEGGVLNNYSTIDTALLSYDAEEERNLGGFVNVFGELNNAGQVDIHGMVDIYGTANNDGTVTQHSGGILNIHGQWNGNDPILSVGTMSLDEFLAAIENAAANNSYYMLSRNVIVDRDVELNSGIMISNGAELIVKDGAVLTNNMEIQVWKSGKLTVEAGGRLDNQGALNCEGTIHISDNGDYAGYVHNTEQFKVGIYAYGTELPSITGIPEEVSILQAECATEDQVNYILSICGGYFETLIRLTEDMVLNTMTIPEKVYLNTLPDLTITVAEDAFLTVNGGLTTRSSNLVVNGKLISNSETALSLSLSEVTVNGTFDNIAPTFINDGSVMTVNGTFNSYAPLHVGFWRNPETASPAGTLIIAEGGVLNNYDYLNICADAYEAEDDRYSGGIVTVSGTLNNLYNAETKNPGFIEQHGDLTVDGHLFSEGILGVNGAVVVNGSLTSQNTIDINNNGTLDLYGDLENNGSLRLNGNNSSLTTYEGASLVNNMSISNRTLGAVITLADGTYTHGETAELVQTYFEGGNLSEVNGAPEGTLSLLYEGSNADTLLAASEMFNWSNGYYQYCYLRVVDDMTFPAGKELNLAPGTYLVIMNDRSNFTGSLTVEGRIYNQGSIRIFAADVTIAEGGYILNENEIMGDGTAYDNPGISQFNVEGLLENAHTGNANLSNVQVNMGEGAIIQNNLKGDQLGVLSGVSISDQTLFTDITEGTQERLQEVIGIVKNDGYHGGYFFISEDMHITSSADIPGSVSLAVQSGSTLTVEEGAVLRHDGWMVVDHGGHLVVSGCLDIFDTLDLRGSMEINEYYSTVETNGELFIAENAVFNVMEGASLTNNGMCRIIGTMNVDGTVAQNGNITISWSSEHTGSISGNVNYSELSLLMRVSTYTPNDDAAIQSMLDYAQEKGFGTAQVHFLNDYTFENDFTVPENTIFTIGTYLDDESYMSATVTVPAGVTLTVDGSLEVAKMSSLVIEEGAELIYTGENFYTYGNLVNNGTILVDAGYPYIDGTNYQHGENAQILLEAYDEDYAEIYGIDRQLVTLIYRGNDEQRLLNFFDAMNSGGYLLGDAYIEGTMTMYNSWYVEPADWEIPEGFDVDVYVSGENSVLNVPEIYNTLGTNTSIYVADGGRVNVTGALFVHADMLIMDGGTVTVDGTMNSTTVYVYEGGKLIVNGNWDGYNPINYGGTIEGECFNLTQDKLEQLLAEGHSQVIMRSSLTLERDLTIDDCGLVVAGEGYVLTVPAGVTLTVNGYMQLNLGAKLDIQGTLVNNGTIIVSGEGTELVNNGTVNNNSNISELMDGKIVNNGTWNEILGGTCGEEATWTLENGVLTISGSGDMLDYAENSAPWDAYAADITEVKIGNRITYLGENVFRNIHVDTILVPRTVEGIYTNAFADDVTLKGYHNSPADTYAYYSGNAITYIHELDPDTGKCLYCDFALDSALSGAETPEEKLDVLKDTDTDTLKDQIEAEMDGGSSDTMDLIEDLDAQAKDNSGITVDATVEAGTSEIITSTFQKVTDEAIVGAALNAEEGVSEVKLVIGNPSGDNEVGEDYNTETGVLFSMTLEGVTDASSLDVPVKITLPVPANISDLSKLAVLHYHNGEAEALKYTLSTGADGKAYVSFVVAGFSDFAIVEEAADGYSPDAYPVVLNIYLNDNASDVGMSIDITDSIADDGVVTLAEAVELVQTYYEAKDENGIGYDGLYLQGIKLTQVDGLYDAAEAGTVDIDMYLSNAQEIGSEPEEPVALFDFGQTSQIWLIEPWALRANLRVYHLKDDGTRGTQLTVDEVAALDDYGVYFIRESDLGIENATQNNVTKDDILENANAIHMTKSSGDVTHNTSSNMLSCDFDEGIYTYELSDSVFVMYYVVKDGETYYAPIRERNLSEMVNKYKDDEASYPDEKERAVFATMAQLEADTLTYRGQWENPSVLDVMDAPTLQTYPLGAPAEHSIKFGHTMNIILIEPWGLQFNGMVTSDVTYDDYGVVVYYDTDGTAAGITEAADLLALESAHVFSVKNGDATVTEQSDGREKITAVYNADLYTYQMTKIAYVMFYVQDGDNFYYGPIKERTIQAAINSRLGVAGVDGSLEGNVLYSMLNLYDAIKAYREGFGIYD